MAAQIRTWAVALVFSTLSVPAIAQGVSYEKVTAEGVGDSYDIAMTSALTQAAAQINGVAVARQVVSTSTKGTATEVTGTKTASIGVAEAHRTAAAISVAAADATDVSTGRTEGRTVAVAGATEEAEQVQVAAAGVSARIVKQDFSSDTAVVSMSSQTSGVINRYQILGSYQRPDGWHVSVLAEVSVYKAAAENQRKKLIVVPLRLEKPDASFRTFEGAFRTALINQLTQSSKLAMLDRDFGSEQDSELQFLSGANIKREESARLGNRLGADFIMVGVVNDASIKTQSVYMASVGRTITGASTASAKISYRVIEAATGRIELADSWEASGEGKLEDAAVVASDETAHSIIDALFPMRVERLSNGVFYLGQGGKTVHVGQRYRVVKLGQEIIDDYTKEVIGREEDDIGNVEVFEVEPKLSKARLTGEALQALPADASGLVVRLVKAQAVAPAATVAAGAKSGKKPDQAKASPIDAKGLLEKNQGNW